MTENTDTEKSERILAEVKKRRENSNIVDTEEEKAELVIFRLGEDYYAFFGSDVKEILPYEPITFVPGCPDYIIGIINVRGDIESVIDIHLLMGLSATGVTKKSRIVIGSRGTVRSGILVDSVEDVISVPVSSLKRPISTMDRAVKDFSPGGETLYENKYVTILDMGKLFGKMQQ